jgi:hypothetical protein
MSRDSKVERYKLFSLLLATKGFIAKDEVGNMTKTTFTFYCEWVGGKVIRKKSRLLCVRGGSEK